MSVPHSGLGLVAHDVLHVLADEICQRVGIEHCVSYLCICLIKSRLDISMMVMCYASDTAEYDGRTPNKSNAAIHIM